MVVEKDPSDFASVEDVGEGHVTNVRFYAFRQAPGPNKERLREKSEFNVTTFHLPCLSLSLSPHPGRYVCTSYPEPIPCLCITNTL